MFLYEKTHRYLKNDYQFFDALKTKDRKIRRNYNLLTQVKFDELEWSSLLIQDSEFGRIWVRLLLGQILGQKLKLQSSHISMMPVTFKKNMLKWQSMISQCI